MPGNEKVKTSKKDDRFAAVQFDPRFQRFPRAKAKIRVDERFKEMFENPAFQVGSTKDKRGRKKKKKKQVDEVKRYYRLDSDEETKHAAPEQQEELEEVIIENKKEDTDSTSSSSEELSEIDEAEERWARIRGLAGPTSSSESESESLEEQDEEPHSVLDEDIETLYKEWGVGAYAANPNEEVPLLPDATPRLACLDLDWVNVRAVDILVALKSFIPKGGRILSVTVYPSDYGLKQMKSESTAGPRGIWNTDKSKSQNDSDDEERDDDEGELDTNKLRHYERSKLRWYYAIVVCDSSKTANEIYNECDGMELMKSANRFDLRFVPDDESFNNRVIRDTAAEVPVDYAAPVFQTKALQHTNVDLTWDKGDDGRKKTLTRKLKEEEIKDEDFKTYLASESEESDSANEEIDPLLSDDPEKIKERYKSLLVHAEDDKAMERKGVKDWGNDQEDDDKLPPGCVTDRNMELQVTFGQGLDTLGERLVAKHVEKQKTGTETVWESYLRRKREKRMEAKKKGKVRYHSSDEEDSDLEIENQPLTDTTQAGDDPFDDPFFLENDSFKESKKTRKQTKGKPSSENEENDQNKRAELEMLLMDERRLQSVDNANRSMDSQGRKSSGNTKLSKKERLKLKKAKKRAEREDGSDNEDLPVNGDFLNMNDPRFQAVFQSEDFALDPTDPRFIKAGPSASKLAKEAAKRRSVKKPVAGSSGDPETKKTGSNKPAKDADLKLMVASLKRKTKFETDKVSLKRKKPQTL